MAEHNKHGKLVRGIAGNYYQDGDLKTCCKDPSHIWMADMNFCPYCNITPEARIAHLRHEDKKERG
jgi:DNA-binding helix-hairpin-helix protein with protein kinase domain